MSNTPPEPVLAIDQSSTGDGVRISVTGELDAATANQLETALRDAVAGGQTVEVDLGGVSFIDSSGLRALLVSQRTADEGGVTLVLGPTTSAVDRLLELTGLSETFQRVG